MDQLQVHRRKWEVDLSFWVRVGALNREYVVERRWNNIYMYLCLYKTHLDGLSRWILFEKLRNYKMI